jgi:peptidyl-prolyl cis-trans isomerase A (cyclophilin A)
VVQSSNPTLLLTTALGVIRIELNAAKAPLTAAHILRLADEGAFAGASFYRATSPDPSVTPPMTIDVIQGGIGWERCDGLPSVAHESTSVTGLSHVDGAVSIGRWADRGATSEIFICLGDQPSLDAREGDTPFAAGFAVFGQVVEGMEVVRAIHQQPRGGEPPAGSERFRGQFLTAPVAFEVAPSVS